MNKVPAKQIYLLSVIIVGIIALSVYSTYALFTFEGTTGDIVSIHIPKSLTISENVYEYQQIKIAPNQVVTTDVDIHNPFEYETCYSVWYKVIGDLETQNNVQIFEHSENSLSTSGIILPNTHLRINILIINDNDHEVKINLGTIGSSKKNEQCSLNLSTDKSVISISYSNVSLLTSAILNEKDNSKKTEANYLTYDMKNTSMTIAKNQKLYLANEFTYTNETFSLTNAANVTIEEWLNTNKQDENTDQLDENIEEPIEEEKNMYFCLEGSNCNVLYQIKNIELKDNKYNITYNKLIGYLEGISGLRKTSENDYTYYGDNPNNYIYYNCKNQDDKSSYELWRIIGLVYDKETDNYNIKIVRNDSIGKFEYDYKMIDNENVSSNNWNESTLNKYLNEEYKIVNGNQYIEKIIEPLEIIPNLEIDKKTIKNELLTNSKINLLTLTDYLNTSTCEKNKINEYEEICFKNNWLNNMEIPYEWTMTAKEVEKPIIEEPIVEPENPDLPIVEEEQEENPEITEGEENIETPEEEPIEEENKYIINYVYSVNNKIQESDVTEKLSVRPVVYLKSRMLLISGDGSLSSPYMVK